VSWTKTADADEVDFMVKVTKSFAETFENLLMCLKNTAGPGHSFSIVVDPDSDAPETFGMDGDGSDHIRSIERAGGSDERESS
jgi:hypothetical protein